MYSKPYLARIRLRTTQLGEVEQQQSQMAPTKRKEGGQNDQLLTEPLFDLEGWHGLSLVLSKLASCSLSLCLRTLTVIDTRQVESSETLGGPFSNRIVSIPSSVYSHQTARYVLARNEAANKAHSHILETALEKEK